MPPYALVQKTIYYQPRELGHVNPYFVRVYERLCKR